MVTNDVFHPDLRRAARFLPHAAVGPHSLGIVRALTKVLPKRDSGVDVRELPNGASVRLFHPDEDSATGAGLLWIHGGGYVIGRAQFDDRLCRRFSRELGATVASVDYRLAPEHPYPAALDDCYAALEVLADLPGVEPSRLAVGGASAGGGLAAALAQRAHDLGDIDVAFQLLVYPMLDDRPHTGSQDNYRLWNRDSNRFGWEAYRGKADPNLAVPARRSDLSGCHPPGSGLVTKTCSSTRTSSTRLASRTPGFPAPSKSSPARSTGSISSHRRRRFPASSSIGSARACAPR